MKKKKGLEYRMDDCLNIAELCPSTRVLGPGRRFAVWVQGCCFDCPNCGSPAWRETKTEMPMKPERLAEEVLRVGGIEGVTVSGGDPMLQAKNLAKFVRLVRAKRAATVVCYTGFTLERLLDRKDEDVSAFLAEIDVLIDGPYVEELNDNKGWRGSTNQAVHFLTGVYRDREREFLERRRDMEIHLFEKHYLAVGIHPKNMDYTKFL